MARRRRKGKAGKWLGRLLDGASRRSRALPRSCAGRLAGPVNRGWSEPSQGITVYIADNGIHADIIMPVKAQGLDWRRCSRERLRARRSERGLDRLRLGRAARLSRYAELVGHYAAHDLVGADRRQRVMHVEYVPSPYYAVRAIRLRPEEYRRSGPRFAPISRSTRSGQPQRIDHPGYGPPTPSTGRPARPTRCGPATPVARWLRLAGSRPASGRPSPAASSGDTGTSLSQPTDGIRTPDV